MIAEKMKPYVKNNSAIRMMFEEGNRLRAIYGADKVYDFSLGNPSVPAPECVKEAIIDLVNEVEPTVLHGYMSNAGFEDVRQTIAESLNRRFGTKFAAKNLIMTVGAASGLNVIFKTILNPEEEVIVFAPYFLEYGAYVRNFDGKLVEISPDTTTFQPNLEEFEQKIDQMLFVSATPSDYEAAHEMLRAEQIIRPTGLLDPPIEVRPVEGQIDDLIGEVNREVEKKGKVLITTLTKRMAEDLTDYMREVGIRVKYLHSDIDTLERAEIIRDMRLDVFDVLVGINLLREGLDIPEISLVAILDADKEGFLRSETSLIQTVGRAARNAEGHVLMYADSITDSMAAAIEETKRRRKIQQAYNEEHNITPTTIKKAVRDLISISQAAESAAADRVKDPESMDERELKQLAKELTKKMHQAAAELNFEEAASLRDQMIEIKKLLLEMEE